MWTEDVRKSGAPRRLRRAGGPLLLALLAGGTQACDIPLELPRWETSWTFLALTDTIATADFLPSGVREQGPLFVLDSISASTDFRLGDVCEFCTCFQGPIPELEITPFEYPLPLPGGLSAASLSAGSAHVTIHNDVPFDLLDNGEGGRGSLLVELYDNRAGRVIDSLRLTDPFPPGDSIDLSFDLGGLELHRGLVARVSGTTPGSGCDSIALTPDMGIRAAVDLRAVTASSVHIFVSDASLAIPGEIVDLPEAVSDRLRPGEARVAIEVEVVSTVGVGVDILLSAAADPADLFTERAALFTPLPIPPGDRADPRTVTRLFLLDLERVEGAHQIHLATRNRVSGDRRVVIQGGEAVSYDVRIHAELPSR